MTLRVVRDDLVTVDISQGLEGVGSVLGPFMHDAPASHRHGHCIRPVTRQSLYCHHDLAACDLSGQSNPAPGHPGPPAGHGCLAQTVQQPLALL